MKQSILFITSCLLLLIGCSPALDFEQKDFEKKIIVEGWIENGQHPVVLLSWNGPFFESIDSTSLVNRSLRWARVTVSDGEDSEILMGHYNSPHYFPYFSFRADTIIGEVGKKYYLKVEYNGIVITSETTIPAPVPLKDIYCSGVDKDSAESNLRQLNIKFDHIATGNVNYRLSTMISGMNNRYIPAMNNINAKYLPEGMINMPVMKGIDKLSKDRVALFFLRTQTVSVKFCTMDSATSVFWKSFTNESLGDMNMFTGSATKIKSNVSPPGIGIWGGYGTYTNTIVIH